MKALPVATLVGLALLVAACDRGTAPPPASAPSVPTIKVTDPGTGEKKVLRFTPAKGTKKTMRMAMDMGMTMSIGGAPRTQQVPTITMVLDVVVVEVMKNGDFRYEFKLGEPDVAEGGAPGVAGAIRSVLSGMTGLSGSAVVTARGFTGNVEIKVPPGADAQLTQFIDSLKQSVSQMAAPLPEEAVGVGATWETTTNINQGGMKLTQVATYKLVALAGSSMTAAVSLSQTAPKQKLSKNGITVDLDSYSGSGGGDTTIDVLQPVPTKATIKLVSDMHMTSGGNPMGMGLDLTVTMTAE